MRQFMYAIILVAMLASWLSSPETHLLPSVAKYLPDLVAGIVILYVFAAGVGQGFRNIGIKYWIIFAAVALVILCGPIVNHEDVGPIVAGTRYYLRSIPFFFLPAVYEFTERDLTRYLKLILALSILQFPVNLYQRLSGLAIGEFTGDIVVGTLNGSSIVSVFIIGVLCMMTAFMLRDRMSKLSFGLCFVPLLIAISINETKVTIFLLPLAMLVTFLAGASKGRRIAGVLKGLAAIVVAGLIFIPLYNSLNKKDDGEQSFTVEQFVTDPDALDKYLNTHAGVGAAKDAGRGDALVAPFNALGLDPVKIAFGLGLGNVSLSGLGTQYSGRYEQEYWVFAQTHSVAAFLFEIGIFGTLLVFLLQSMTLMDALYLIKRDKGIYSDIAVGFVGVWFTAAVGLFYTTLHVFESVSFLFWFLAGLIAAQRQRLIWARARVSRPTQYPELIAPNLKAR